MTDLNSLLTEAGRAGPAPIVPDSVIDADLTRGRRALARQRMRRAGGRAAVVGSLALATVVVLQPQDGAKRDTTATPSAVASTATAVTTPSIQLVAYTGEQPPGYTVGSVPDGWEIQGVNEYALVIAKQGFADQEVNSFVGKLVVMLQSRDAPPQTTGARVAVGPYTGYVTREGAEQTAQLFFTDSAGRQLVVQVPPELHWSDAQIGEFGASVQAHETAEAGRG